MSSFPILPKIRLSPHPLPPSLSLSVLYLFLFIFSVAKFVHFPFCTETHPGRLYQCLMMQKHKKTKTKKTNQNQYSWTSLNIGPKPGGNQRYKKKPEDLSMCREARVLGWNNTHIKQVHQQKPITPPLGHCSAQQTLPLIW